MDLTYYFDGRGVEMCEVLPGLRVPRSFGDPDREHMATRRAAGLFDFSFMGCVEIRGPGAIPLLEAVQTRRVADLVVGRIRYTLLLRDDGTVLNDATVWRTGEEEWLLFVGRRDDLRVFSDMSCSGGRASEGGDLPLFLEDRSAQYAVIALQGPHARNVLAHTINAPDLPYFAFADCAFGRQSCRVARIGYSGEFGYEIVIDANHAPALWEALRDAGAADGLAECGFTAMNSLRIEAGHILFSNELACRVTPRELRLERLVERNPRTAPESHAAERRLVGLLLDGPTDVSSDIDRVRGHHAIVTSACRSPLLERWIGLGFVSDEGRYAGTRVQTGANARATVARLPFYDPLKRLPRTLQA